MRTSRWALLLAVLAAKAPVAADIASKAGTRSAQFLRVEPGARHAALGGTYIGYGDDPFALWGEPAALADPGRVKIALQHNEFFLDLSQEYAGLIFPLKGTRAVGLTVNFFDEGDLTRATEDAAGDLVSLGGTFDARDLAVGLHYGQRIGERLAGGVAFKYIESKIDDVSATSFAFDAGLRYRLLERLTVGASIANLGRGLKFLRKRDDLPLTYRVGAAYVHPWGRQRHLMLAADLWKGPDTDWEVGVGAEARVFGPLFLRAGYRTAGTDLDEGVTAGAGFRFGSAAGNEFALDYAYVPFGVLGDAHRVSLSISWGPATSGGWSGGGLDGARVTDVSPAHRPEAESEKIAPRLYRK